MNDPVFSHYLITRFNVPVDHWKRTREGEVVRSEEWLSHRFRLFEAFCLPSVRNQGNQDFTWLVFFGADTPDEYKQRIASIAGSYGNFVPLYIGSYNELLPAIIEQIRLRLPPSNTHVITSRLDNDDAIHKDYVAVVQGAFVRKPIVAVDIPDGYNLSIEPIAKIGKITRPYNQFISLIEEAVDPKTVFSRQHVHWARDAQTIAIRGDRLWIQVIHEKNMLNAYRRSLSGSFERLHADFGVPQDVVDAFPKQNGMTRMVENVHATIYLGLRKARRSLVRLMRI